MIMTKQPIDFSYRHYTTYWDASLAKSDYYRRTGYVVVNILSELIGKSWDARALAFVLAMNPRCIRVSDGMQSADASNDRITIIVTDTGIIRSIQKEISIGLVDEWRFGADAENYLRSNT
jgi:hypothetical protein